MNAHGNKMQTVICNTLEYMKLFLEHMVSRLSHNNVDEMDATLSSQFSEASEPEWWHLISIARERKRPTVEEKTQLEQSAQDLPRHDICLHTCPVTKSIVIEKTLQVPTSLVSRLPGHNPRYEVQGNWKSIASPYGTTSVSYSLSTPSRDVTLVHPVFVIFCQRPEMSQV
ncbi:hypothetical protein M513_13967 [Trichuris suis]|uniref:Uncharacterized protein n=1 Tax=Trichuris suis TaxID=68888 RepID=A0A085LJL1_9BILA|nr:hypothetical protein M513_13967 [Trichuris suis]